MLFILFLAWIVALVVLFFDTIGQLIEGSDYTWRKTTSDFNIFQMYNNIVSFEASYYPSVTNAYFDSSWTSNYWRNSNGDLKYQLR